MKKVLTMMVVVAVATVATADLTSFLYKGGKLFDNGSVAVPAGTIVEGAAIQMVDLSPFVFDNGGQLQIDIADIPAAYALADVAVGPVFQGGTYSTLAIEEDPATIAGQTVWFVFDPNGGGIADGDFIGIAAGGDLVSALTPPVGAGDVQVFNPGDVTSNVQVIPEPATFGLMGLAGLGLFLARKKARR